MRYFTVLLVFHVTFALRMPFFLLKENILHFVSEGSANSKNIGTSHWDTCDNFYKYSCHKWMKDNKKPLSEPIWNQYIALSYKINARIQNILTNATDINLKTASKFYKCCLDTTRDKKYLNLFQILLEKSGGWSNSERNYNFIEHLIEIVKKFNVHSILKFHVDLDYRERQQYVFYIESADLNFPDVFLLEPQKYSSELEIYKTWIKQSIHHLFPTDIKAKDAQEIIHFEMALANLKQQHKKYSKMELSDLPNVTNWNQALKFLFEDTNVDYKSVEKIYIHAEYLNGFIGLIENVENRIVSNYIIWTVIREFSRNINSFLRKSNFEVDHAILGVKTDLTREYECTQEVLKYFVDDIIPSYKKKYLKKGEIGNVKKIALNIKQQFIRKLNMNNWMSDDSKSAALTRINELKFEIGFGKKQNNTRRQLHSNYLLSWIKLREEGLRKNLQDLGKNATDIRWPIHYFDVNAYYSILQNTIILPLGILNEPFFHENREAVCNYGALGSLIGHEISHALDLQSGLQHFILKHQRDRKIFSRKIECYKELYENFNVNTSWTLSENVADNIGLELSYEAVKEVDKDFGKNEGLFYQSYSQMWCETTSDDANILFSEEHAPVEIRVLGTFVNFNPFKQFYSCPSSNLKCDLW